MCDVLFGNKHTNFFFHHVHDASNFVFDTLILFDL
jgi:hypothetical protein